MMVFPAPYRACPRFAGLRAPVPVQKGTLPMASEFSLDRRELLASLGVLGAGAVMGITSSAMGQGGKPGVGGELADLGGWDGAAQKFVLPPLGYAFNALEPHIDTATMEIHYSKHHQGYVNGLNKALDQIHAIQAEKGDPGLIKHWVREVSFNGSGHVNHTLFWNMMAPASAGGGGEPSGELRAAIDRDFGSYDAFKGFFSAGAAQVEASGWAWLVRERLSDRLMVIQGEKQQDLMVTGAVPILGIDVWEHAYYLKHQNKRADYIKDWWNVVNWSFAQSRFEQSGG